MKTYDFRKKMADKDKLYEGVKFEEAEDSVSSTITTVIDTNWGGSNDEQMRAVQMLKFLATSDDPLSNKFMKALDKATSGMSKDNFKENVIKERRVNKYEFTLPTWSLSYLVNGDDSGMSNSDLREVQEFERGVVSQYGSGHWSIPDEGAYFSHSNDINNLGSNVVDAEFITVK